MKGQCTLEGCIEPTQPDEDGMARVYCPQHTEEYLTAAAEQLEGWVEGNPEHNTRFSECCPDFSCCRPELLAPVGVRHAFKRASAETRESMLWDFLGGMVGAEPTLEDVEVAKADGRRRDRAH